MHKTNNTSGDFNKLYRIPTFTTGMWFECNYMYTCIVQDNHFAKFLIDLQHINMYM